MKKPPPGRYARTALKIAFFLIGIPGIYISVLSLLPRVSVSQPSPVDASDPFATRFVISNDGWVALHKITFSCGVVYINAANDSGVIGRPDYSVRFTAPDLVADELLPARKATIPCVQPVHFKAPVVNADVAMVVEFRPDFLWWRREEKFRLLGTRQADGFFRWEEQPMRK
jgi:hypothetical protein